MHVFRSDFVMISQQVIEPILRIHRAYRFTKHSPKCDKYLLCELNAHNPNEKLELAGFKPGITKFGSMAAAWFISAETNTPFWLLYGVIGDPTNCVVSQSNTLLVFFIALYFIYWNYMYVLPTNVFIIFIAEKISRELCWFPWGWSCCNYRICSQRIIKLNCSKLIVINSTVYIVNCLRNCGDCSFFLNTAHWSGCPEKDCCYTMPIFKGTVRVIAPCSSLFKKKNCYYLQSTTEV